MKFNTIILAVTAIALAVGMGNMQAATNDVSATLQKGLFEEEANRNLDAAIQAYQAVVATTDKDRQYGATAVFRLGECYRKQGKTNEAALQYQRILREFPEQTELVAASRQQIGPAAAKNTVTRASEMSVEEIKKLSPEMRRAVVQQQYPNPVLDSLMEKMLSQEQLITGLTGASLKDIGKDDSTLTTIYQQIDAQVDAALATHAAKTVSPVLTPTVLDSGFFNSENSEVKRIQTMIKESPDLINAPDPNTAKTPLFNAADQNQLVVAKFLLDSGADTEANGGSGNGTPLLIAIANGNLEMVELLLAHGASTEAGVIAFRNSSIRHHGAKALQVAVEGGRKEIAATLLAHGAKVNATDDNGKTPLHAAAEKGFKSLAELLLQHGANVNAQTMQGTSVLESAVGEGNKAIVDLLLTNKADVNTVRSDGGTALYMAAEQGNLPLVEKLLAQKADLNLSLTNGTTPLMVAVQKNHPEVAESLLAKGADMNRQGTVMDTQMFQGRDEFGWTALHFAVDGNQENVVKALLAKGAKTELMGKFPASPNLAPPYSTSGNTRFSGDTSYHDFTPLMLAVFRDRKDLAQTLISGGAKIDFRNSVSESALQIAVAHHSKPMVEFLLENKANANVTDYYGSTMLDLATTQGQLEIAKLLLDHGADPNLPVVVHYPNGVDYNGYTPLHFAVLNKQTDILSELLTHGANINAQTAYGLTPLHMAVPNTPNPCIALLVDHGADLNLTDTNGNSPLDAFGDNTNEVTEFLRQYGAVSTLERRTIRITRNGQTARGIVFFQDSGSNNYHTLYEVLAYTYPHPLGFTYMSQLVRQERQPELPGFYFPDFAQMKIRRRAADGKTNFISVDVESAFTKNDCSQNLALEWGDVVELPELDHNVSEGWSGLRMPVEKTLTDCLARHVDIVVKGKATKLALGLNPRDVAHQAEMDQWQAKAQAQEKQAGTTFQERLNQIRMAQSNHLTVPPPAPAPSPVKATPIPPPAAQQPTEVTAAIVAAQQAATQARTQPFPPAPAPIAAPPAPTRTSFSSSASNEPLPVFWLSDVVRGSKLLLASSDVTRIKVKRAHPAVGRPAELFFNLDKIDVRSDLWLEDGDVIEIPEK